MENNKQTNISFTSDSLNHKNVKDIAKSTYISLTKNKLKKCGAGKCDCLDTCKKTLKR